MDATNAERQRRYIRRLKARAARGSDAADEIASLKRQLAAAKTRIRELTRAAQPPAGAKRVV